MAEAGPPKASSSSKQNPITAVQPRRAELAACGVEVHHGSDLADQLDPEAVTFLATMQSNTFHQAANLLEGGPVIIAAE